MSAGQEGLEVNGRGLRSAEDVNRLLLIIMMLDSWKLSELVCLICRAAISDDDDDKGRPFCNTK